MGRVSDAMWRAGQREGEPAGGADDADFIDGDDHEFVSGQDEEAESTLHGFSPPPPRPPQFPDTQISRIPETQLSRLPETLLSRHRAMPFERARGSAGADDEVRIADVLGTLFHHRWLMAFVIAGAVASAVAYNYQAVPIFEARARLIIEPNSPEVVPFRGASMEDQGRLDYYNTQIEVIRSRALARSTLERLHLLSPDAKAQVDQVSGLLGGLGVVPVKSEMGESRVLSVTYRSPDPELAARVANELTQTYVDQNLETRRQGSRAAFESLNQRLGELRTDVGTSQGAVQHYREQKDAVSLGDQGNIVVQKLAQLNSAVTSARMDRLDRQTLYEQLKQIRQSGAPLDTFSPILSNAFLQGLKADLAGLQRERSQLSERLGDAHPDMIKVNTSIATAERRLNEEMAKIVEGIENDYVGAKAREEAMSQALETQKREVLELSQKSIGFNALQRDATSTQQMFDTVLQRVKETELSSELQSNNAKILDRAEVPRGPISPRKQLNLILALLGGCCAAVGLAITSEHLNPRLAKHEDIAAALGLPVLGTAPRISGLKALSAVDALPVSFQEAVRAIRTRILLSPIAGAARALAVTSTNAGEGKTLIASNLAASMALAGRRVLLVDADLRRPQLHQLFKSPISPGLSDLLTRDVKLSDALIATSFRGLFLLAAGADVVGGSHALDSQRLTQLIEGFRDEFDVIVLDCPPVMPVADATIIANAAGSVLFVVASGTTSRSDAQIALDRLASVQAQVVGVVVNKARPDSASAYHYERSFTEHTA
ncbi:MAG: polysaccharide biosynthesis tyrosine autokinase [Acidobacteriota bacterium]